MVFEPIRH